MKALHHVNGLADNRTDIVRAQVYRIAADICMIKDELHRVSLRIDDLLAAFKGCEARGPQEPKTASAQIREIMQSVAQRYYGVTVADLVSQIRTAKIVRPRQIAMYLARTYSRLPLPEIGHQFGGRDHTTVLHAVRKIEVLIEAVPALAAEIAEIRKELGEGQQQ
jgi:chromosomal replication initiation ATPase DnaA